MAHEGGCLCGATRYQVEAELKNAAYCHCRMCQLSAGAPVMLWDSVPEAALTWTRGQPKAYRSSEQAERLFCPECGTQLVFNDRRDDTIDLNVVTLDEPGGIDPRYHIWTASRQPWFEIKDELPRYPESKAAGQG